MARNKDGKKTGSSNLGRRFLLALFLHRNMLE